MNITVDLVGIKTADVKDPNIKFVINKIRENWRLLAQAFNSNISLGGANTSGAPSQGNINGQFISFTGTGSQQTLVHQLMRIPTGWFVVDKRATGDVWRSAAYTSTQIKVTATSGVAFVIFVF